MRTHLCFDAGVICNRIYSDNIDRYIPTADDRHTSSEDTTSNHDHHISQMLFVVGRLSFTRCHGSHKPGAIPAFRRMVTALRLSLGLTNLSTHITAINIRVDIVAVVLAAAETAGKLSNLSAARHLQRHLSHHKRKKYPATQNPSVDEPFPFSCRVTAHPASDTHPGCRTSR